jgi:hypothetical protein
MMFFVPLFKFSNEVLEMQGTFASLFRFSFVYFGVFVFGPSTHPTIHPPGFCGTREETFNFQRNIALHSPSLGHYFSSKQKNEFPFISRKACQ